MALFVAVGAAAERSAAGRTAGWPAECPSLRIARPVAQLPTETPVGPALWKRLADRDVMLTEADGVARGLLDMPAARALADRDPRAPRRWLPGRGAGGDRARRRRSGARSPSGPGSSTPADFLLVDDDGQPAGVLRREDIVAVLNSVAITGTGRGSDTERPSSDRPCQRRDMRESRFRPGRPGAVDRLQGPQIHRRAGGGGDLSHPPRRPRARRPDRSGRRAAWSPRRSARPTWRCVRC